MRDELERKLVEKYPRLYRYPGWNNIRESLMAFGMEHGDGWYDIIDNISDLLTQHHNLILKSTRFLWLKRILRNLGYTRHHWTFVGPDEFHVVQIKEKYGRLCYYTMGGQDDIERLIIESGERDSEKTCEECGFRNTGWLDSEFVDKHGDKLDRRVGVKLRNIGSWIYNRCDDCFNLLWEERYGKKPTKEDIEDCEKLH